jgi:hypothetical protein
MIVGETFHLMQREHYRDLLRDADQERMLAAAFPRPAGQRRLRRLAAGALRGLATAALQTSEALGPQLDQRSTLGAAGQVF